MCAGTTCGVGPSNPMITSKQVNKQPVFFTHDMASQPAIPANQYAACRSPGAQGVAQRVVQRVVQCRAYQQPQPTNQPKWLPKKHAGQRARHHSSHAHACACE